MKTGRILKTLLIFCLIAGLILGTSPQTAFALDETFMMLGAAPSEPMRVVWGGSALTGTAGEPMQEQTLGITLISGTWDESLVGSLPGSGILNLPAGLTISYAGIEGSTVYMLVSGTPETALQEPVSFCVPAGYAYDQNGIANAQPLYPEGSASWMIESPQQDTPGGDDPGTQGGEEEPADPEEPPVQEDPEITPEQPPAEEPAQQETAKTEKDETADNKTDNDKKDDNTAGTDPGEPEDGPEGDLSVEEAEEESPYKTNEELIWAQTIVNLPAFEKDFRFVKIDAEVRFFKEDCSVLEAMEEDARVIGTAVSGNRCSILREEDGWCYIESGDVRGFVPAEMLMNNPLYNGPVSEGYVENHPSGQTARVVRPKGDESDSANEAFVYTHTTARDMQVEKVWLIAPQAVDVLEEIPGGSRKEPRQTGRIPENGLAYLLVDCRDGWFYIESDDVRGFAPADGFLTVEESEAEVLAHGEESFARAEELLAPEENRSLYYTMTSVETGHVNTTIGCSLVRYAAQFVGHPYVWGGTDLLNGCDCSGFVQGIYAHFGYELPRTSREQCHVGTKITLDSLEPGDLVFYARDGRVYHVAMYAGNGMSVEAYSSSRGIIYQPLQLGNAVWGVRVVSDTDTDRLGLCYNEKLPENVTEQEAPEPCLTSDALFYRIQYGGDQINVTMKPYLKLDGALMWLAVCEAPNVTGRSFVFEGVPMRWSDTYGGYCCLVVDNEEGLGEIPAAVRRGIKLKDGAVPEVDYSGDINGDGVVNQADADMIYELLDAQNTEPGSDEMAAYLNADMNGDRILDIRDAAAVMNAL